MAKPLGSAPGRGIYVFINDGKRSRHTHGSLLLLFQFMVYVHSLILFRLRFNDILEDTIFLENRDSAYPERRKNLWMNVT